MSQLSLFLGEIVIPLSGTIVGNSMSNASRSLFPNKRSLGIYGEPQKLDSDLRLDCVTVKCQNKTTVRKIYIMAFRKKLSAEVKSKIVIKALKEQNADEMK